MFGENAFRMELHAEDRSRAVAYRHDLAILGKRIRGNRHDASLDLWRHPLIKSGEAKRGDLTGDNLIDV